jgi:hypothetical protein
MIIVTAELAREGIQHAALDYWTGYWGTRVERFVGRTTRDLARFLVWAEDNHVTLGDEIGSEEGRGRVPSQRLTMLGFQAAVPAIEYALIEAAS